MPDSTTPPYDPVPEVYRSICRVQKAVGVDGISKDGRNQQQGYSFRGIDDIYNSLSPLLAAEALCILPRMLSRTQEERQTAKGGVLFYVVVRGRFDFVSSRDGSRHMVIMYGEAMDSADKATNKAMSAAYKYACMQVFCIPTKGTPDADAVTHQPAPRQVEATPKPRAPRKPPQAAVAIAQAIPEPREEYSYEEIEFEPGEQSQLEEDLRNSILQAEQSARAKMLRALGELKARYGRMDALKTYYAILGLWGVQHATEFREDQEGVTASRGCWKELNEDVVRREVRRA